MGDVVKRIQTLQDQAKREKDIISALKVPTAPMIPPIVSAPARNGPIASKNFIARSSTTSPCAG